MPAETHVEHGPLDRNAVFEIVRDRLADILEIEPSTITEGQSFVDDLDADSLALIELVEALEEELGERTVGFRIEDEDLDDLKTVRDAVDYVYDRGQGQRDVRPTSRAGPRERSVGRLGYDFVDPALLRRALAHRSWCAEVGGQPSQRAPRVPRRRRARLGRRRPRLPATTATSPRASSPTCARAWSTPPRWPRWPTRSASATCLLLGKGEDAAGGRQKPSILSDALRGGARRGLPRRRRRRPPRRWSTGCSASASTWPPANSTGSTTRPCCRSSPPGCSTRRPCTC